MCHIWELGGGTLFPTLLTAPLAAASQNLSNLTVILILDLSNPQQLWFTLETMIQNLHAALRKHASSPLKENSGKFIENLQEEAWKRVGKENEVKIKKIVTYFIIENYCYRAVIFYAFVSSQNQDAILIVTCFHNMLRKCILEKLI